MSCVKKTKKKTFFQSLSKRWLVASVFPILLAVVAFFLCLYFVTETVSIGANSAKDAYEAAKNTKSQEVYQSFYDTAYESAEEAFHLSNQVSITLGDIRETAALEVLSVSAVGYSVQDKADNNAATSWLKVTGTGTFTVNLQAGEFIVDDERQYVLVRVPKPVLTGFSTSDTEPMLFEDGSFMGFFNGDNSKGADLALAQVKEAALDARLSIISNQRFYQSAETSAELMIENLVRALNQDVEDLTVEIEFMD